MLVKIKDTSNNEHFFELGAGCSLMRSPQHNAEDSYHIIAPGGFNIPINLGTYTRIKNTLGKDALDLTDETEEAATRHFEQERPYLQGHAMTALGAVGARPTTTVSGHRAKVLHAVVQGGGQWVTIRNINKRVDGVSTYETIRLLKDLELSGYVESRCVPTDEPDEPKGGRPTMEWRCCRDRSHG